MRSFTGFPHRVLVAPHPRWKHARRQLDRRFHRADSSHRLGRREPGILVKLFVKEGESITAGQPLARLDREVHEITAKIAKRAKEQRGRLNAAQAASATGSTTRTPTDHRAQTVRIGDEIARAETELSIAEANLLAAEEQLAIDTLEYEKARAILERRELRSPIDGVVVKLHREEREFVSVINPTVVTVVQLKSPASDLPVPTTAALKLAAINK